MFTLTCIIRIIDLFFNERKNVIRLGLPPFLPPFYEWELKIDCILIKKDYTKNIYLENANYVFTIDVQM